MTTYEIKPGYKSLEDKAAGRIAGWLVWSDFTTEPVPPLDGRAPLTKS